jgi:hypothetical protein
MSKISRARLLAAHAAQRARQAERKGLFLRRKIDEKSLMGGSSTVLRPEGVVREGRRGDVTQDGGEGLR